MLLRDYLLLNMGKTNPADALAWRTDMTVRRRIDATRDLLCFWRPDRSGAGFEPGTLVAFMVMGARLTFGLELSVGVVAAELTQAAGKALAAMGTPGEPAVHADREDGVVLGQAVLPLGEAHAGALANALAFYLEEAFAYAPAAKHPVAYEESLRLQDS
jgi:hypothetical protein